MKNAAAEIEKSSSSLLLWQLLSFFEGWGGRGTQRVSLAEQFIAFHFDILTSCRLYRFPSLPLLLLLLLTVSLCHSTVVEISRIHLLTVETHHAGG